MTSIMVTEPSGISSAICPLGSSIKKVRQYRTRKSGGGTDQVEGPRAYQCVQRQKQNAPDIAIGADNAGDLPGQAPLDHRQHGVGGAVAGVDEQRAAEGGGHCEGDPGDQRHEAHGEVYERSCRPGEHSDALVRPNPSLATSAPAGRAKNVGGCRSSRPGEPATASDTSNVSLKKRGSVETRGKLRAERHQIGQIEHADLPELVAMNFRHGLAAHDERVDAPSVGELVEIQRHEPAVDHVGPADRQHVQAGVSELPRQNCQRKWKRRLHQGIEYEIAPARYLHRPGLLGLEVGRALGRVGDQTGSRSSA